MKKIIAILMICALCFGFVGCEEEREEFRREYTEESDDQNSKTTLLEEEEEELSPVEKIMKENNASVFAKDIEFDIENNLDKNFFVHGKAELSNYYNYGFDDSVKKDYFCIKLKPMFETSTNDWYLYCNREQGQDLYEDLLKNKEMEMAAIGVVWSKNYQKGQNNMAELLFSSWGN